MLVNIRPYLTPWRWLAGYCVDVDVSSPKTCLIEDGTSTALNGLEYENNCRETK
jgi:hypothetical protein